MTDKCQAPGLECGECRLKCQLPLIEAEKAQRERAKRMTPYQSWDFCRAIDCTFMVRTEEQRKTLCRDCKAYQMHQYLKEHGQIVEEGSELFGNSERLKAELNRLQVALEATIKEKDRFKIAFDIACQEIATYPHVKNKILNQARNKYFQSKAGDSK